MEPSLLAARMGSVLLASADHSQEFRNVVECKRKQNVGDVTDCIIVEHNLNGVV